MAKRYTYTKSRSAGAVIHTGSQRSGEVVETTQVAFEANGDTRVKVSSYHVPSGRVSVSMCQTLTGEAGRVEGGHYVAEMEYRHARR